MEDCDRTRNQREILPIAQVVVIDADYSSSIISRGTSQVRTQTRNHRDDSTNENNNMMPFEERAPQQLRSWMRVLYHRLFQTKNIPIGAVINASTARITTAAVEVMPAGDTVADVQLPFMSRQDQGQHSNQELRWGVRGHHSTGVIQNDRLFRQQRSVGRLSNFQASRWTLQGLVQRREQRARPNRLMEARFGEDSEQQEQQQQDETQSPIPNTFVTASNDEDLGGGSLDCCSSYLYHLIRENRPCSCHTQTGWPDTGCNHIVLWCRTYPKDARYISPQQRSPLHEACLRNACRHVVRALLDVYPEAASLEDGRGNTPLHLAFVDFSADQTGSSDMEVVVKDLLRIHSAPMSNEDLNNPLHMACMAPETTVSPSVILRLASSSSLYASSTNKKNETPLHLFCKRRNATVEVAKVLLEAHPMASQIFDIEGWTPIHHAAANANVALLKYFVSAFPNMAKIQTSNNETALHILCRSHQKLHRVVPQRTHSGVTGRQSIQSDIADAAKVLLAAYPAATMAKTTVGSYNPLHLLCKGGDSASLQELLQLLLDSDSSASSIADADQYLPLHHACEAGCSAEIVRILLGKNLEAAQAVTRKQDSALSLTCLRNISLDTVNLLIEAYPNALTLKNQYGFAPIHCVCRAHQPRLGIVKALLEACPSSSLLKTNSGETPIHLVSRNRGASVSILYLFTRVLQNAETSIGPQVFATADAVKLKGGSSNQTSAIMNKIGNTPLYDACFQGRPFEHIETLLLAHPDWISIRNAGGSTALQMLCRNGRIDDRLISLFFRIGGVQAFSVLDASHSTPLHSAIREDAKVDVIKCLIRANPDALRSKTIYGDTPLHLACIRNVGSKVVLELAVANSCCDASLLLEPNLAGQTPIGIAVEEFRKASQKYAGCLLANEFAWTESAFDVLALLVKILYYGPVRCQRDDGQGLSLLHASLALHRQGVGLDSIFIRRVLQQHPEEAFLIDEEGNYACHIEASIPVEKLSMLDGQLQCCRKFCREMCHERAGVLSLLLDINPGAIRHHNKQHQFPLGMMINSGRKWGRLSPLWVALRAFPAALHSYEGLNDHILPFVLDRIVQDCGPDTLFFVFRSRPGILEKTI
jgi:ankyrin repeat protein